MEDVAHFVNVKMRQHVTYYSNVNTPTEFGA
jgi:hypothetical protein